MSVAVPAMAAETAAGRHATREAPRRDWAREETKVLRKYYTENDIFLSTEGILKLISILGCVMCSILVVLVGSCGGRGLQAGGAGATLGAAAALALLYAARASGAPLHAPQAYLYTDIIVSSVAGVLLLMTGALSLAVCELGAATDYIHGPLAMVMAGMVTASAVTTYSSAMRQWDAAAPPRARPQPELGSPPHTRELEV